MTDRRDIAHKPASEETAMPDAARRFFDAKPQSVGQARDFAADTLADWALSAISDEVRLCVSELAANAIVHGTRPGCGFLVRLALDDGYLRIEVHDSHERRPRVQHPASTDVTGRGLLIVAELSDDWGVEDRPPYGKVVWSRFRADPGCVASQPRWSRRKATVRPQARTAESGS